MAKYKQVEFAKLCGIPKSSLPSYKKRKQVIVTDGMIDDQDPVNLAFLLKFSSRIESPVESPVVAIVSNKKSSNKKSSEYDVSYHELEKQKKALDIEKIQQEIELLAKRNMKMDGESVPTDIVKSLFSLYGKNMTTGFHNSVENWLTKIAKMVNLSDADLAEMRVELRKGANEAVEKAQMETKRSLSEVIKEYSLKREVGEHD